MQVARANEMIGVRDSKNIDGPMLVFGLGAWSAFIEGIKAGEFTH